MLRITLASMLGRRVVVPLMVCQRCKLHLVVCASRNSPNKIDAKIPIVLSSNVAFIHISQSLLRKKKQSRWQRHSHETEDMYNERISSYKVPVTWTVAILCLAFGSVCIYFIKKWGMEQRLKKRRSKFYGNAAIGGPFELTTHTGQVVTEDDFIGKWLLIYFGFTNCPDVCPEELEKLSEAINIVKCHYPHIYDKLVPLFFTVDPARDTADVVGKYILEYHPRFIGLTGTQEQVDKATKAFRIYYSESKHSEDEDYVLDHSIVTYLLGPDFRYRCYFSKDSTPLSIVQSLVKHHDQYSALEWDIDRANRKVK